MLTLLATLVAASSILAVMPGAVAEPRPTLRQAQTRVAALHHEAEAATERYNEARLQMVEVQRELRQVTKRLDQAKAEVGGMQSAMGQMAAASYKSGGVDMAMQLMFADDPQAFLQQATALDQLSRRQGVTLRRITAARQQLAQDRLAVDQQRDRLAALQSKLEAEKRTIEDRIASAERVVASLRAADRARLAAARRAAVSDALAARGDAPRASRDRTQGHPQDGRRRWLVHRTCVGSRGSCRAHGLRPARRPLRLRRRRAQRVRLLRPHVVRLAGGRCLVAALVVARSTDRAGACHGPRLQPGDLVFFYSPISHVGIYIGGGKMIDAPYPGTSVRITSISQLPYSGAVRP